MEISRILIGSPVYQDPKILEAFLNSLIQLDQTGLEVDFYFVDDNKNEESSQLLYKFSKKDSHVFILSNKSKDNYIKTENTHLWKDELVWKVAEMKNKILAFALENNYDYVFFIDSDIVLHKNTLIHLIQQKKDIISEIFWTRWNKGEPLLPQVWLYDHYTLYEVIPRTNNRDEIVKRTKAFLEQLTHKGVYRVGGLGACTLISKAALEKGVSFSRLSNVSFWGEDRHFCIRAVALGLELYVDTHYPALHLYREEDLAKVEGFIEMSKNS